MTSPPSRIIVLEGPFSDEDLAELCDALGRIDKRHPEKNFTMTTASREPSEARRVIDRLLAVWEMPFKKETQH